MDELIVEGLQVEEFLLYYGINFFVNFGLNCVKYYVLVMLNGYVIGDYIIFCECEDKFVLVGCVLILNWLMFVVLYGNWNVCLCYDLCSLFCFEGECVLCEYYWF